MLLQERKTMKDITSSIYSFEKLRQENYLYVDKTEHIWNLLFPAGGSYFLSRPRRFGKSLTVSILKAIFEGKKELSKTSSSSSNSSSTRRTPSHCSRSRNGTTTGNT